MYIGTYITLNHLYLFIKKNYLIIRILCSSYSNSTTFCNEKCFFNEALQGFGTALPELELCLQGLEVGFLTKGIFLHPLTEWHVFSLDLGRTHTGLFFKVYLTLLHHFLKYESATSMQKLQKYCHKEVIIK